MSETADEHLLTKMGELHLYDRDISWGMDPSTDMFYVRPFGTEWRFAGRISDASDWTLEQLEAHVCNVLERKEEG